MTGSDLRMLLDDMPTAAESERVMAADKAAARREVRRRLGDSCGDVLTMLGIEVVA